MKLQFGGLPQQFRADTCLSLIARLRGFFKDIADTLEGDCERGKVLRWTNRLERSDTFHCVHKIIGASCKCGVDLVVCKAAPFAQDVPRPLKQKFPDLLLSG